MSHPKRERFSATDWIALFSVSLLGAALRVMYLNASDWVIDSDEAIVGLMAKHILDGAPWPVFYYGQAYMGSLEAFLAALSFSLFGMSSFSLKLVPLVFSVIHLVLVYVLCRRFVSTYPALLASICLAVAPNALILWSGKARGGFLELVVIGTWALILAVDILRAEHVRRRSFFYLGLVFGLGWWVNNQIIFYGVPVVLVFAVIWPLRAGPKRTLVFGSLGTVGFLLGGAPFWAFNLLEEPRFQSLWLFAPSGGGDAIGHLSGYFSQGLPIILGARRFWADLELFPHATLSIYVVYACILLLVLGFLWRLREERALLVSGLVVVLVFFLTTPAVFSASRFGSLSQAPRYLLPLYSVLGVVIAIAVSELIRRKHSLSAHILVGLLLAMHIFSNYPGKLALAGQPFVYKGERVAIDHGPLYDWLSARNYTHIHTDYWIGYRTAFETNERITFSRFRGPKVIRIPEYELAKERDIEDRVFVLTPLQAKRVGRGLRDLGFDFRAERVGDYYVLHHLQRIRERSPEIELIETRRGASSRAGWLDALVDGELGTRWGSGAPQAPGMFIEFEFEQEYEIDGIVIDQGFWMTDYARELSVEFIDNSGLACRILDTRDNPGLQYVVHEAREIDMVFPPVVARRIRIAQHGSHPILDWSIAEVRAFGKPRGNESQLVSESMSQQVGASE